MVQYDAVVTAQGGGSVAEVEVSVASWVIEASKKTMTELFQDEVQDDLPDDQDHDHLGQVN